MPHVVLIPEIDTHIAVVADYIDTFTDTQHRLRSQLGSEPVESGVTVTDHVVAMPDRIELRGLVSDLTESGYARPTRAWQRMQELHKESEPFSVSTPWGLYREMVIHSLDAVQAGGGMEFELKLQQIIRVSLSGEGVPEGFVQRFTLNDGLLNPAKDRSDTVHRGLVGNQLQGVNLNDPLLPQGLLTFQSLENPEYIAPPIDLEYAEALARSSAETKALDAILSENISKQPPFQKRGMNWGKALKKVILKGERLSQIRSISGIGAHLVEGLENFGPPGLTDVLADQMRRFNLGTLPEALTTIGREGRRVGETIAGADRISLKSLKKNLDVQRARNLIARYTDWVV